MRRRDFLVGTAALARMQMAATQPRARLLYVASYSSPQGPEGAKGRGEGIYLFSMDPSSGALTRRGVFRNPDNPSWLALNHARTRLYSANETRDYQGQDSGSISAYAVERESGLLTLLNTQSSHGAGPCYISLHPSGKHLFVANYHGGTVAVLPIDQEGKLGEATDVKADQGQPGPARATSAPAGSFAISGHDRTHAHMIQSDPSGRFVLSADLGLDQILVWGFDAEAGKLLPREDATIHLPPGDGPRHFAFHSNGRRLYSLQEESSTLVRFDFDADSGKATARQTLSTLPRDFAGTNFTSEVLISADARFLYAANRLHDSIAWFSIAADGPLRLRGEEWTRGDYPRSFTIDPSGEFLYSCNQRGDAVACFRVNRQTGTLSFTGEYTSVGTPAQVLFLT